MLNPSLRLNLKNFLDLPQAPSFAPNSPRLEPEKSAFGDVVQKEIKTMDDAMIIYERIRKFRCFETFFSQNLKTFDMDSILNLCRSFKYEHCDMDQPVFLQGSPSNNKFYVILSGEVAVIIGKNSVGEFGDAKTRPKKPKKPRDGPKIIFTQPEAYSKKPSIELLERKDSLLSNTATADLGPTPKSPMINGIKKKSFKDFGDNSMLGKIISIPALPEGGSRRPSLVISENKDQFLSVTQDKGEAKSPRSPRRSGLQRKSTKDSDEVSTMSKMVIPSSSTKVGSKPLSLVIPETKGPFLTITNDIEAKSPRSPRMRANSIKEPENTLGKLLLAPSVPETGSKHLSLILPEKKNQFLSVTQESLEPKSPRSPSRKGLQRKSTKDSDTSIMGDKGIEKEIPVIRERRPSTQIIEAKKPELAPGQSFSSNGIKKMRALVKIVSAVRGFQANPANEDPSKKAAAQKKVEENEEEESEKDEDEDKKEFEEYASQFGKIVRYFGQGDSFGELALKSNAPRSATILCRTDCEFLILEKQEYDLVFGQVQKEKEEFLKDVFSNAMAHMVSTGNMTYLTYFFKPETFGRGQYVIKEGTVPQKEGKLFVLQRGTCIVEKKVIKELPDPFDKNKILSSSCESVTVAVIKRGSIMGEEILDTKTSYEYSVKVSSESILVQAISRREFMSKFPRDFLEYMRSLYAQKKVYRDEALEKFKAQSTNKQDQYRKDHIYCFRNVDMNSLVTKSAAHGLSKHIYRENKIGHNEDPILQSITLSPKTKKLMNTSEGLRIATESIEINERRQSAGEAGNVTTPSISGHIKTEKSLKSQDEKIKAKLNFLSKLPEVRKVTEEIGLQTLQNSKFFADEKPSHHKPRRPKVLKLTETLNNNNTTNKDSGRESKRSSLLLHFKPYLKHFEVPSLPSLESAPSPIASTSARFFDMEPHKPASMKDLNLKSLKDIQSLKKLAAIVSPKSGQPVAYPYQIDKSRQDSSLEDLGVDFAINSEARKKRNSLLSTANKVKRTELSSDKENMGEGRRSVQKGAKGLKRSSIFLTKVNASQMERRRTLEPSSLSNILTLRTVIPQRATVKDTSASDISARQEGTKEESNFEQRKLQKPKRKRVGVNLRFGAKQDLLEELAPEQLQQV